MKSPNTKICILVVPSTSLSNGDKERKALNVLTPNKPLTKLPILLAQIKAENNSIILKNEIRQKVYLLYQHNNITKTIHNTLVKSL